jgi:hypothetical protein
VARLPSRRSGLMALRMGGSPSHPSSSHPPTSLRGIEFQGQRAAFGSPGQWSPNTVFNSRWKLTLPFQVPSTAIVVSFSAHPLISSPAINSECYSHSLTSSQGPFTSHILIYELAIVLGQSSYIYKLGETGCYNSLPLKKEHRPRCSYLLT